MVFVLIPAHNNRDEVMAVLGCLAAQTYADLKVVLVDDGSTDGTAEEVMRRHPSTVILKGDGNLWWTGANAMGVEYILKGAKEGDFILLLNNDLSVEPGFVAELVRASEASGRALVGSTLVDIRDPERVSSGVRVDGRLNIIENRDRAAIEGTEYDVRVDMLPGRGTLVPIEAFRRAGNFDSRRLPHYGADYEFSVRARRAGFKLIVSHRARVRARLDITGLDASAGEGPISFGQCCRYLFSKKSKANVFYYLNYVRLCSEKGMRLSNSLRAVAGIFASTVMRTPLFYPLRSLFRRPALPARGAAGKGGAAGRGVK